MSEVKLTQLSHGGGCGCKIAPSLLQEILGEAKPAPLVKAVRVRNVKTGAETELDKTVIEKISAHDPDFATPEPEKKAALGGNDSPEIARINEILDQTVRPALQMDGGDIQLVDYKDNTLRVFYQGACGSCPSATMGTLKAIENILRDQFNPNVVVELVDAF